MLDRSALRLPGLLAPLVLAVAATVSAATGSGGSAAPVAPITTSWEEIREYAATHAPAPPHDEDAPEWWLELSAEDRALIAPIEYENPMMILEAKKRHRQFAAEARAAVERGEKPPKPPKSTDPARAFRVYERVGPPAPPAIDRPLTEWPAGHARPGAGPEEHTAPLFPSAAADSRSPIDPDAPTWYTIWTGPTDGWRPSDSTAAVGPAHVGVVVNSTLAFYTKDGAAVVGPVSLSSWFSGAPQGGDLFDPKIVYDRFAGHWIVLALNGRDPLPENYYAISVSQTSNPEGGWWTWYLRSDIDGSTDTNNWTDYPGLGFDSGDASSGASGGGVYVTSNQYSIGGGFQHGKARVLYKYQLYSGSGLGWWDFWNSTVFAWKPAVTDSSTGSPTEYLANTSSGGASSLTLWTLTNPLGSGPTLTSRSVSSSLYGVPPTAEQQGGGGLDTGDCRTQDLQYRNGYVFLTSGDYSFWGGAFDTDAVVHYWKIPAASGGPVWDGYFGSDNQYFYHGKIAVDSSSNAHVIFSQSGPSNYARIGVLGILASDGVVQSYNIVQTGSATYDIGGEAPDRWGDYAGLGFDCAGDESGSWGMSQVATSTTAWRAYIAGQSFALPNVFHLANGVALSGTGDTRYYTWKILSGDWSGVSVIDSAGGDYDLTVSSTCPFGAGYQSSAYGAGIRDFTMSNGTLDGTVYHHAKVTRYSGATGFVVEPRSTSTDVSVGTLSSSSIGATELMRLYEAILTSGKTYAAVVDSTSGSTDFGLFAFRGSRQSGKRSDNDGVSNSAGAGGDETLVFTASESSTWGFAIGNENGGSGNFTFKIWLKPLLASIPNTTIPGGSSYTGPTPGVTEGTTPLTFSLDTFPSGMTINSSTGVVSWTAPLTNAVVTVTVRATNPAGFSTVTWQITVTGAPGRVPDGDLVPGVPLKARRVSTNVRLDWTASCNGSGNDFEIYEGTLSSFTSHAPKLCSTTGLLFSTFAPATGDRYYLVVPKNGTTEGSYGFNSAGVERPRALSPCVVNSNLAACP